MAGVSKFNQEIAAKILDQIANNVISMRHICAQKGFPTPSTVYKWLSENKDFSEQYARARESQAEIMAEEILDISDDATNDFMTIVKGDKEYVVENKEWTSRSKLRTDNRKWLLSKLLPKKYGDKQEVTLLKEIKTTVTGVDPPDGE